MKPVTSLIESIERYYKIIIKTDMKKSNEEKNHKTNHESNHY